MSFFLSSFVLLCLLIVYNLCVGISCSVASLFMILLLFKLLSLFKLFLLLIFYDYLVTSVPFGHCLV